MAWPRAWISMLSYRRGSRPPASVARPASLPAAVSSPGSRRRSPPARSTPLSITAEAACAPAPPADERVAVALAADRRRILNARSRCLRRSSWQPADRYGAAQLQPDRRPRRCAVQRTQWRIAPPERDQPGDNAGAAAPAAARVGRAASAQRRRLSRRRAPARHAAGAAAHRRVCGSSPMSSAAAPALECRSCGRER